MKLKLNFYVAEKDKHKIILECITSCFLIAIVIFQALSQPFHMPNAMSVSAHQAMIRQQSARDAENESQEASSNLDSDDESVPKNGKYNLNSITEEQLTQLPGIGPTRAKSILSFRKTLGGFSSLEQLKDIKGIGEKTFEKIKPYLYVD